MKKIIFKILKRVPYLDIIAKSRGTQCPVNHTHFIWQKIIGINRASYWPVHFSSIVTHPKNIYVGIDTCPGYSPGCYIQGKGKIYVGDYTQIAPNVGIISSNHSIYDNSKHNLNKVRIGEYCWLGMGSLIMPGVELGDFTVVGAGAVVTKSFVEGYCVIGGNPAKIIKTLDKYKCVRKKNEYEYNGYILNAKFDKFRAKNLNI